jgi:hypothetical protein
MFAIGNQKCRCDKRDFDVKILTLVYRWMQDVRGVVQPSSGYC